jgi:replicative DNA helicase
MKQHIPVFITVQFNRNQKDNSKKAMDLSDIGGTDSIPQDASIVFGIRRAEEPHDKTRREIVMLKNREGDVTKATINFLFEPVNLDEINVEDEQQEQRQENQYDAGWMG